MANSGDADDAKGKSVLNPQTDDQHDRKSQIGDLKSNSNLAIPEASGKWTAGGNTNTIMHQHLTGSNAKTKDCLFFFHTGSCSFGENCRYNHSDPNKPQVENQGYKISRPGHPCKFYLAGFCKYGFDCRFAHTTLEVPSEPDHVGYPIRECDFGDACKFDHPDRYLNNYRAVYGSNVNAEVTKTQGESYEVTNGGHKKKFSESAQPYYPLASIRDNCVQYQQPNYTSNGYQVPTEYTMGMEPYSESLAVTSQMVDNLPPQEEKVTSFSVFPSVNAYPNEPLVLNEDGLPLRPGKTTCWFYEKLGVCKHGISCTLNHPPRRSSKVQEGSSSNSAPSGETPKTKK